MRIQIETERLFIRNIALDDYLAAFQWCGDPIVNTYMLYPLYENAEDVKGWISSLDSEAENGAEVVFILKENGVIIGGGGIHCTSDKNVWEIGYNLNRAHWGHGYAPEAMQGLIDYLKNIADVKAVQATFCAENLKSLRVAEKLGMTYLEDGECWKLDGSKKYITKTYRKYI